MLEVQMIGNLGGDPEARYTAEGTLVTTFRVACTRRWTDRDGQKREETTWVEVSTWGALAEVCHQHLVKGRKVFVRGRPEVQAFLRKNGEPGAALRVTAGEVVFLDGKGEKEGAESPAATPKAEKADDIPF